VPAARSAAKRPAKARISSRPLMSMTGLEDRVYREAIDHDLDLAIVQRAAIAREEIVDRRTIFEVACAHAAAT
jgi:hypothetical protein